MYRLLHPLLDIYLYHRLRDSGIEQNGELGEDYLEIKQSCHYIIGEQKIKYEALMLYPLRIHALRRTEKGCGELSAVREAH